VWYTEDEHGERVENSEENDVAGVMFVRTKRGKNGSPAKMQGCFFVYFKIENKTQKK
jgi:hypothetical protein